MNRNVKKDTFKEQLTVKENEEEKSILYQNAKEEKNIDDIINMVNKNPKILDNLSISKLEKINSCYDKKIEELRMKIRKLKNE